MEARRPSNQAVDARERDPRLKRAKPQAERLRSLAAQAACGILVAVAALLALPPQTQAQAQVLVSNVGQNSHGPGELDDFDQAQAFTTGGNSAGYTLTSVEIDMQADTDYSTAITVSVHSNNSGAPGTSLGTLSNPTSISRNGVYAFTTGGIALAADTTYFVVIDTVSFIISTDVFFIWNTNSNAQDPGGASGWSIGNDSLYRDWDSNDPWTSFSNSKKIRVKGIPNPPPGAPETPAAPSIGATEGSNNSLDVGWLEPANAGPFVKYDLRYRKVTDHAWTTGPGDVTAKFANITGLSAGTTYEVQVRASNDNGASNWSPSRTAQTDSGEAPGAPTNLNATAHGHDRIDLSWTAPSSEGGRIPSNPGEPDNETDDDRIRSYKIEVRSAASDWLVLDRTIGSTDTVYSHRDVPAGVIRCYRVSATNTAGTGPPSNEAIATTDGAEGTCDRAPTPDPQMQQSQTPLTASFASVPPAHDGETPFWLELTFDAPVAQGSKPQLQALLNVTGGVETRFRRKDGQLDHWQIRIAPSSQNAVTVMLSPSPPCGDSGAVCTDDGRTFTTGLGTQIHGPASGNNNWSEESDETAVTPVPALPLAGIGLLGLLLALLGSRRGQNDRRQLDASRRR